MAYQSQLRTNYANQLPPNLFEGLILRQYDARVESVPNNFGKVAQVQTITPGVATQEVTTYKLRETTTGQTVQFVSDATPTAAEVVTGLLAALRANAILAGMATFSGSTTVIATNRKTGTDGIQFNFVDGGSTPTNVLTVANTTAAADGSNIPVGTLLTQDNTGKWALPAAAFTFGNPLPKGIVGYSSADFGAENAYGSYASGLWYPPNHSMPVLSIGEIVVRTAEAVNPNVNVFASTNVATRALYRATTATNYSLLTAGMASWRSAVASGELAILSVNFASNYVTA